MFQKKKKSFLKSCLTFSFKETLNWYIFFQIQDYKEKDILYERGIFFELHSYGYDRK